MPTWPGINNSFLIEKYKTKDQRVIRCFATHFYVTRDVDPIRIGNSIYKAFIMRPSDNIAGSINVDREIVVVLADYKTFEIRTLDAYERVFQEIDGARIDHSFRFLVSDDEKIQDAIRHYLQQDPEYPVVVAMNYNEMSDPASIVRSIRNQYLVRDLFGYQSALQHEYYFFGRDHLVNQIVDTHNQVRTVRYSDFERAAKLPLSTRSGVAPRRQVAEHCRSTVKIQPSMLVSGKICSGISFKKLESCSV